MADKETDDILEEDSSKLTPKSLSKSMLIKIAIGLLVLLIITGGAYFFFMSSDKPSPDEAATDINGEIISPEQLPDGTEDGTLNTETQPLSKEYTPEDIKILKMREEAVALKEENLQMKERLTKLEGQQDPNVETAEPAVEEATSLEDDTAVSEPAPALKAKPKTNPYANLYSRDSTLVREPQRVPPPEPKWGNFDPLYRGK